MSNNQVNAIFKDSNGFIWIGTLDGIDRYDGVELRHFSNKFSEGIESVKTITEDLHNNLWIGTSTGLFRFDAKIDSFERVNIASINSSILAITVLPDSNLWVGTTQGLYLVNTNTIQSEKLALPEGLRDQNIRITGIFPDKEGNGWIASSRGLFRYSLIEKKGELFQFNLHPQTAYNSFTSICGIGDKLYLGTTNVGIVEFDLTSKLFSKGIPIDSRIILNVASDNKEFIFVGTDGGGLKVINVHTREVRNIVSDPNDSESLSSNSIYSFLLDQEGRYWIGTYSAGICFTKNIKSNFSLHHLTADFPDINKSIRSFYFSLDGAEYFGTRNGFAYLPKNKKLKFFQATSSERAGLRANIILSIFPFQEDILIGTYGGGVSRFSVKEQKMKPFLANGSLDQGNIYAFALDKSENLWITSFNGLYRYSAKDQSLVNYNTKNSVLHNDQIFEITFDSKGRMWVGTMAGAYVYSYQGNQLESLDISLISNITNKTNYIYEDRGGNIWICTERGGLIMIDPDLAGSTVFRVEDGLSDNSVCTIMEGSRGEYWISTLKGLCKYSVLTGKFTRYSLSEGMPSLVFSPKATYLAPDSTIYLGNEKGLLYFDPEEVNSRSFSSKIIFTDFYISGKKVNPGKNSVLSQIIERTDEISLNDQMNNIGFRFVALNYINPLDNSYQFKLEGYDKDWKNNGNTKNVYYQDLEPGDYIFKVRNANESEAESSIHAEIKIHIYQSFFNSIYFYALLSSLVIAGIFLVVRYVKRLPSRIKQKNARLKNLEKYKGARIPKTRGESIINELKRRMQEEKLYLNPGLKLDDLASDMNYPKNEISQVLNQDLNKSFSDFVNQYRVEEVKKLMAKGEHEKFTLVALAKQCGFNSKTSFYRVFKKETDKTPADYLKEMNCPNEIV